MTRQVIPGVMRNAYRAEDSDQIPPADRALIARRERLLGPAYRLFYAHPLHIVRGEGVFLYDAEGRAYLDAYNNVACVGHGHPEVVDAIARQAAMLNTHTRYIHDGILNYADRLLATLSGGPRQMMFTCTGSEANDLALRVARAHTKGTGIIVTELAYHGVTEAVSRISPSLGRSAEGDPGVRLVPAPDRYRAKGNDIGAAFAAAVEEAIEDMRRAGISPAALIVDTIFSSDGVLPDPAGFLAPAVEVIHRAGGLFIADEVQPGFARTGPMWGFMRHGIDPDLVTIGKPMGNGYPVAAMIAKAECLREFAEQSRYFNTFGGSPVACAAAMAVLDIIERERLGENARATGDYLRDRLGALAAKHDLIGDVRGAGLFVAAELVLDRANLTPAPAEAGAVVNRMREDGVIVSTTGTYGNALKIRPPLVFSRENADQFVEAFDRALSAA